MVFGEVVKMVDQYYKFSKMSNGMSTHLTNIKNSIDEKLLAEYGRGS